MSEEKIVFGLVADRPSNHTLSELVNKYAYSHYDTATIGREVGTIAGDYNDCLGPS